MKFASGKASDVGRGRSGNEDRYLVEPEHHLYAVADGMGGHRAGEVASATAIESLSAAFEAGQPLDEAVEEANAAVFAKASSNLDMRGMGTTLTAVTIVDDRTALFGHVGDSRAYLMRDDGITQVTDDHSLVEQLVREGRLSPEEAAHHPQRAVITRALGVDADVEVDTYRVDLRSGDRLVLCSDGLTNMVSDEAIAGVLRQQTDPQRAAEMLVKAANEAGGDDNITVVVVDALGDATAEGEAASAALGDGAPEEATGEWVIIDDTSGGGDGAEDGGEASGHPTPAPGASASGKVAGAPRRQPRRRRARGVVLWSLPVLAVLGVAIGAVGWYARQTYYVGLRGEQVALFRGVPGGLLGWSPTVARRSALRFGELTPAQQADLRAGHRFSSRSGATQFLDRLEESRQAALADEPTTEPAPAPGPGTTPAPVIGIDPVKPPSPPGGASPTTFETNR